MNASIRIAPGGVRFGVRVEMRSRREGIGGFEAGELRVRVAAPPTEGRANQALVGLLAARLQLPQASVRITAGARSRSKTVEVAGVDAATLLERLRRPPE